MRLHKRAFSTSVAQRLRSAFGASIFPAMTIRGASWVGLVVGAVLGMGGFRPGARADAALVNGVAAIVNGHVITAEQVEQFAEPALRAALRQYMGRSRPTWDGKELEIKKAALEELIDRKLVIDEFRVKGYNMPDSIIDDLVKSEVREDRKSVV